MVDIDMEEERGFGGKDCMSQKANTMVKNGKEHGLGLLFQMSSEKNNLCEDEEKHYIHETFGFQKK